MPPEPAPAPRHETLLEHRAWVRALARSLVERSADADDVEQQTWVAALDAAPADARSMRAWLATVARNAARKLHRGEGRRRRREAASDPRGPSPSAATLAEQAEVHARVVAAVVALDEPYREAVLLRHFEGLGVSDAADRAGVPLETMRARLRRARDMLRARLGEEFGPERPWRLALLPLLGTAGRVPLPQATAGTGAGVATAVVGGTIMGTKVIAGVVAAALLVGAGWWTMRRPATAPALAVAPRVATPAPASAPRLDRRRPRTEPSAATDVGTGAPAASTVDRPATTPSDAGPRPLTIRERLAVRIQSFECAGDTPLTAFGRLADATGIPIVLAREVIDESARQGGVIDLQVWAPNTGASALELLTKLQGGLSYVIEDDRIVITPGDGKWDASRDVVVAVHPAPAPDIPIRGRVMDSTGVAVAGAIIVHGLGGPLDVVIATTNASGDFEARLRRPVGRVHAAARGHVDSLEYAVDRDPTQNDTFDLRLRGRAGDVVVHLRCDATPLPQVSVWATPERDFPAGSAGSRPAYVRGHTGSNAEQVGQLGKHAATVTLTGVPIGTVHVAALAAGWTVEPRDVEVVEGKTVEVELSLVKAVRAPLADRLEATRVSCEFKAARVADVVGFLSQVGRVNIIVLPAAAERVGETPVSLSIRDEPLAATLRTLCDAIGGVVYEIRGDVVCIDAAKK